MLYGVYAHRAFANRRGTLDRFEVLDFRIDGRLILQILSLEFDSMIYRRGMQFQRDFVTGMQRGAAKAGSLANCMLKLRVRGHLISNRLRCSGACVKHRSLINTLL